MLTSTFQVYTSQTIQLLQIKHEHTEKTVHSSSPVCHVGECEYQADVKSGGKELGFTTS